MCLPPGEKRQCRHWLYWQLLVPFFQTFCTKSFYKISSGWVRDGESSIQAWDVLMHMDIPGNICFQLATGGPRKDIYKRSYSCTACVQWWDPMATTIWLGTRILSPRDSKWSYIWITNQLYIPMSFKKSTGFPAVFSMCPLTWTDHRVAPLSEGATLQILTQCKGIFFLYMHNFKWQQFRVGFSYEFTQQILFLSSPLSSLDRVSITKA